MAGIERGTDRKTLRVLVADDDPIQRNLVAARLVGMQAEVCEAEDGLAAWSVLQTGQFDLAIVDLAMPDLDGFGLIQCMRGHPRTRHLPIVVVTSRSDRAAMDAALHAGASSFLVKPIAWATFEHHLSSLMHLVRSADEAREAGNGAVTAFQDLAGTFTALTEEIVSATRAASDELQAIRRGIEAGGATRDMGRRIEQLAGTMKSLGLRASRAAAQVPVLPEPPGLAAQLTGFGAVVAEAHQLVSAGASSAGVKLRISLPNTPVLVACEPGSLVAALRYLLRDAVSHADRGSEVSLDARFAANRSLLVEIAAAGVVEGHDLSGQMAAPPPQGRNAGPAIGPLLARATIEAMGGTLLFSDAIDSGRTTRLSLPSCRVTTRDAAA